MLGHVLRSSLLLLLPALSHAAGLGTGPTSCDQLPTGAVSGNVNYATVVQFQFDVPRLDGMGNERKCTDCHIGPGAGTWNLRLDAAVSYDQLVNQPSTHSGAPPRVRRGDPNGSLLFWKINCDDPVYGARMIQDGPFLTLAQQALIYDWIKVGAPQESLMVIGFESR